MAVTGPSDRSWALSLADPFVIDIGGSGYAFGEYQQDIRVRAIYLEKLRAAWGVRSRADLLLRLQDLRDYGMHSAYEKLQMRMREPVDWRAWLRARYEAFLAPRNEHRAEVVERDGTLLGSAGVLAYDISRYVNLVRWGYQVGYLTQSEAWLLIMPTARLAQSSFDSWDAYGTSFLVGRDFWSGATAGDPQSGFIKAIHDLKTLPDGAWRIHPWGQRLDRTPIRAADLEVGDSIGAQPDPNVIRPGPNLVDVKGAGIEQWAVDVQAGPAATAAALLIDGNVVELEQLLRKAASGSARDVAGRWKRSQVYAGIASVFPDDVNHPLWSALDRTTAGWVKQRPASHMAAMARAQYWISHAWAVRGNGYPSAPSIEMLQVFQSDLSLAEKVVDVHGRAFPKVVAEEPHWAVLRIKLANLQGREKTEIYQQAMTALKRHPDYDPIASETALALNPVWGGTQAVSQAFIEEAMVLSRPFSGEQRRAQIALHLARNAGSQQALLLAQAGFTWEQVKPSIDEVIARFPDAFNINAARVLACISDDPTRARPYFLRLQGHIQPVTWYDDPWYVGQCAVKAGTPLVGHAPWPEDVSEPVPTVPIKSLRQSLMIITGGIVLALLAYLRFRRLRAPVEPEQDEPGDDEPRQL